MTYVLAQIVFWSSLSALAYAQVGYPALMLLFARRRRTGPQRDEELPSVSLIIPAHNEAVVIQSKLENALQIDYPPDRLEIIVASDGSQDRTVEIAEEFAAERVRVLAFEQRRGKASVVNDAVAASGGEVVCLCDANVMFRPDALRLLVRHLSDPQVGAASGDVRLASEESDFGAGESLYYRIERAIQLGESRIGSMIGVDGGMFVLWRALFRPLPPDTILDDFLSSMNVIRQHRRIVYEPDAIATENGTPTWQQEFRRRVRVTAGAMQCLRRGQYPPISRPIELWQFTSHKLLRWAGPMWLLLLLVSAANLRHWAVAVGILWAGLILAAAFVVSAGSVRLRRSTVGGILGYFVMSHVAMLVGILQGTFCRPTGHWSPTARTGVRESVPEGVSATRREATNVS